MLKCNTGQHKIISPKIVLAEETTFTQFCLTAVYEMDCGPVKTLENSLSVLDSLNLNFNVTYPSFKC